MYRARLTPYKKTGVYMLTIFDTLYRSTHAVQICQEMQREERLREYEIRLQQIKAKAHLLEQYLSNVNHGDVSGSQNQEVEP